LRSGKVGKAALQPTEFAVIGTARVKREFLCGGVLQLIAIVAEIGFGEKHRRGFQGAMPLCSPSSYF
jgi:hypothetical protein